jgi:hypothetical protein
MVATQMPPARSPHQRPGQLPGQRVPLVFRVPKFCSLVCLEISSEVHTEADGRGWEVWFAQVIASWSQYDLAHSDPLPVPDDTVGWDGQVIDVEVDEQRLVVRRLQLWLLRLEEEHPAFPDVPVVDESSAPFDAADEVSQALHDTVGPVVGTQVGGGMFADSVYTRTG